MLYRKIDRRLQRVGRVFDVVVLLEAGLEPVQDRHGFGHGGLDHVDLLETTGQRAVLFEHAAVFLEGGRTDAAQLAVLQHGLDQVGRVHGATRGRTGTDDGVDFVHEQDRARFLLDLLDDRLQALFEVAAVLGAGHKRAQVERIDGGVLQDLGHLALDDAPGQALGQRGLAHAGFADVERVVLAAPAQHLDGALDFVVAADQRVDLALAGQFVEVGGELLERVALGFTALLALGLGFGRGLVLGAVADLGDAVGQVIDHVQAGDFLLVEEIHRMRVLLAEDRHQHVGAGDLLLARGLHVVDGALQHPLETQGRLRIARVVGRKHRHGVGDDLPKPGGQARLVGPAGLEHAGGGRIVQQRQQQVLDRHELMAGFAGLLVTLADGVFEVLAEHALLRNVCSDMGPA